MKIYLASSSPRRREILENLGLSFEIIKPVADESSDLTDPAALTELLAKRKAEAAEKIKNDGLIIGCDTVVCADGEILGKPRDEDDAKRMIKKLSGRRHEVVSGICLIHRGRCVTAHEISYVDFCEMNENEIESCVRYGAPMDKAGGYAVQGFASLYIKGIVGDYFNVVGLPVNLLYRKLREDLGVDLPFGEKFDQK